MPTPAPSPATGPPHPLALYGLTGGIGSGKSTIGRMIAELGVPVLDADQLAREVVLPGQPALAEIAAAWPEAIAPDGTMDRAHMGKIVFADRDARARLETILHPRIRQRSREATQALAAAGHRLAFYEASLLVEVGRYDEFSGLVVVTAPEQTQVSRATARGNLSETEVLARMAAQLPLAEKVKVATHVIENGGDLETTRRQVVALVTELRARHGGA